MGKSGKIIAAVIVVVLVAGGGLLLMGKDKSGKSAYNTTNSGQQSAAASVTVTYTDSGFSLSADTVKSGDSVKFVNNAKSEINPSSNPHPIHTDNPELNVGDIEPGSSKTVTLHTKGTWGFHNHYDHAKGGTITVE